jgi:hypothetical protein
LDEDGRLSAADEPHAGRQRKSAHTVAAGGEAKRLSASDCGGKRALQGRRLVLRCVGTSSERGGVGARRGCGRWRDAERRGEHAADDSATAGIEIVAHRFNLL